MTFIIDTYGIRAKSIYQVKSDLLDTFFGYSFEERESLYRGGDYFEYAEEEQVYICLQHNSDGIDYEEPDFAEYPFILCIQLNDDSSQEKLFKELINYRFKNIELAHLYREYDDDFSKKYKYYKGEFKLIHS